MKFSNSAILAVVSLVSSITSASDSIRIQHWNLRNGLKNNGDTIQETIDSISSTLPENDGAISWYENYTEVNWSDRRIGIANDVVFNKADIFTINEGYKFQIDDLITLLDDFSDDSPAWRYVGFGRDDGKEKGEYEAILYDSNKIQVQSNYTIWLSETPFEPSKVPSAGSYRTATIGRFKIIESNKYFTLITTHLDDQSEEQRQLGATMLKIIGAYEYEHSNGPVFLTGDFNSFHSGTDSGAYEISVGEAVLDASYGISVNSTFASTYNSSIVDTFKWDDFWLKSPKERRSGHYSTFAGFKKYGDTSSMQGKIDFQFGGNPNSNDSYNVNTNDKTFKVLRHRIGEIFYDREWHLSDHRPLISDVEF